MNCQLNNTLVVGTVTSITGTVVMKLVNPEKKINIVKHLIIFFIVGALVHFILELFNFNNFCYEKKCYGDFCRIQLCKT